MNTKVTIRDVAAAAGVSISSVHFALTGKAGVSDETREKIRRTAEELGYQPNAFASNLKRSTQRAVLLLPSETGDNQHYYPPVWKGIHDYMHKVNLNVSCIELPFSESDKLHAVDTLKSMVREGSINGILTIGHIDGISAEEWEEIPAEQLEALKNMTYTLKGVLVPLGDNVLTALETTISGLEEDRGMVCRIWSQA